MKKTFTLIALPLITFFVLADAASAQASATGVQQGFSTFAGLITKFNNTVVKALAALFISGAVVAFFFGIAKFVWGLRQGQEKAITDGKQFMIWGLVALFVMFSVYGIIKVTQSLVPGLDSATITIPSVNYGGNGLGTPAPGANTGGNPLGVPSSGANTGTSGNNPSAYVGGELGTPSPGANTGTGGNNPSAYVGGELGTPSSGASTGQTGDAICRSYGPGTGCTTSSGLSGVCNNDNICQPN